MTTIPYRSPDKITKPKSNEEFLLECVWAIMSYLDPLDLVTKNSELNAILLRIPEVKSRLSRIQKVREPQSIKLRRLMSEIRRDEPVDLDNDVLAYMAYKLVAAGCSVEEINKYSWEFSKSGNLEMIHET